MPGDHGQKRRRMGLSQPSPEEICAEHNSTSEEEENLSKFDKMVGRGMYAAAIGAGLSPDEARVRGIQAKRRIRYHADQ